MSKPQWLIDHEMQARRIVVEPDHCCGCSHFGRFVKNARHLGKEHVEVHECSIHPNCLNTKYSICCDDFVPV